MGQGDVGTGRILRFRGGWFFGPSARRADGRKYKGLGKLSKVETRGEDWGGKRKKKERPPPKSRTQKGIKERDWWKEKRGKIPNLASQLGKEKRLGGNGIEKFLASRKNLLEARVKENW